MEAALKTVLAELSVEQRAAWSGLALTQPARRPHRLTPTARVGAAPGVCRKPERDVRIVEDHTAVEEAEEITRLCHTPGTLTTPAILAVFIPANGSGQNPACNSPGQRRGTICRIMD